MGKKSKGSPYVDYYLSFHLGFCHGPVDELLQVWIKEKPIFAEGQGPYISNQPISVNLPDLFGGNEREGGAIGTIQLMLGARTQSAPSALASRLGLSVDNCPGFRGYSSLVFHGDGNSGHSGFEVGSNTPSVPAVAARWMRVPSPLITNFGTITRGEGENERRDVNPVHMIFDVLTDNEFGMGADVRQIDMDSFREAAATLFDESFGLSFLWTRQGSIESFIREILDHIDALFFFNPFTGKATLKLLRNDYDPETLREVGPDSAELKTFRRQLWGESVNEIVVSWSNPANMDETETITFQDPASINMQGAIVSETRQYIGIHHKDLAIDVGNRDIARASLPLATATIIVNRIEWKELPGQCIKFTWPAHGISKIIMRVMDIDWGKPSDSKISVNLIEDLWAIAKAEYEFPQQPEFKEPPTDPNNPVYEDLPVKWTALPYSLVQADMGDEITRYADDKYPNIVIAALVTPAPPTSDGLGNIDFGQQGMISFVMHGPTTDTLGNPDWRSFGDRNFTAKGPIINPIPQAVRSDILLGEIRGGPWPHVGAIGIIGGDDTSEEYEEWVLFEQDLGNGNWRIVRGILDTVPRTWAANATIWILSSNFNAADFSERLAHENEIYKLQPRTSKGLRDLDLVGTKTTNRPDRLYRPYRPANVRIENVMFGTLDHTQDVGKDGDPRNDPHAPRKWTIDCTWSRRNRTLEDSIYRLWDEGDVTPEDDQTTEIIVLAGGEEISRQVGLTGTSATFDIIEHTARFTTLTLKFISRRNGLESLQGVEIGLELYRKGNGSDWGYLWGGWPEPPTLTEIDADLEPFPTFGVSGTIN